MRCACVQQQPSHVQSLCNGCATQHGAAATALSARNAFKNRASAAYSARDGAGNWYDKALSILEKIGSHMREMKPTLWMQVSKKQFPDYYNIIKVWV
eukprot:365205-Chlamydomonas_euryale.AAC.17